MLEKTTLTYDILTMLKYYEDNGFPEMFYLNK